MKKKKNCKEEKNELKRFSFYNNQEESFLFYFFCFCSFSLADINLKKSERARDRQ
jgi:hypothetical protein